MTRCAQVPQPGTSQVRPDTEVLRRVQTWREIRGAAGKAHQHHAALRTQLVASAREIQVDLEAREVWGHLRHHADGQEQERKREYVGEFIMCHPG